MDVTVWQESQETYINLSCCSYNEELFSEPFDEDFFEECLDTIPSPIMQVLDWGLCDEQRQEKPRAA